MSSVAHATTDAAAASATPVSDGFDFVSAMDRALEQLRACIAHPDAPLDAVKRTARALCALSVDAVLTAGLRATCPELFRPQRIPSPPAVAAADEADAISGVHQPQALVECVRQVCRRSLAGSALAVDLLWTPYDALHAQATGQPALVSTALAAHGMGPSVRVLCYSELMSDEQELRRRTDSLARSMAEGGGGPLYQYACNHTAATMLSLVRLASVSFTVLTECTTAATDSRSTPPLELGCCRYDAGAWERFRRALRVSPAVTNAKLLTALIDVLLREVDRDPRALAPPGDTQVMYERWACSAVGAAALPVPPLHSLIAQYLSDALPSKPTPNAIVCGASCPPS